MQIASILDNIDVRSLALPAFQRGFVWKRLQVRNLSFVVTQFTRAASRSADWWPVELLRRAGG